MQTISPLASYLTITIGVARSPLRLALEALAACYAAHVAARAADGITGLERGPLSTLTHDALDASLMICSVRLTKGGLAGARGAEVMAEIKRLALGAE